jgi:hypothetical protein
MSQVGITRGALALAGITLFAGCSAQLGGRGNRSGAGQVASQNGPREQAQADALEAEAGSYPVRLEVYGPDREPLPGATIRVEDADEVRVTFPPTDSQGVTHSELRYARAAKLSLWEVRDATGWRALEVGVFRPDGAGYRVVVRVPGEARGFLSDSMQRRDPEPPALERRVLGDMQQRRSGEGAVLDTLPWRGGGFITDWPDESPEIGATIAPYVEPRRVPETCWVNHGGDKVHKYEGCPYVYAGARAMPCDEAVLEARQHRLCITCSRGGVD